MRVKVRISIYEGGRKITREDLKGLKDPLSIGLRYIAEFKYLEATKWLMLSKDCFEKYYLLGLLNVSLGQEHQATIFFDEARKHPKTTNYSFHVMDKGGER
ncbi:MAG: hypothetical protein ACK4SM_00455 [Aquificaceae bacterium]